MNGTKHFNVNYVFLIIFILSQMSLILYLIVAYTSPTNHNALTSFRLQSLIRHFRHRADNNQMKLSVKESLDLLKEIVDQLENDLQEPNVVAALNITLGKTPWYMKADKMQRLNDNPVFRSLQIQANPIKPNVHLLLIVSSAPTRIDRRKAIRETWWKFCNSNARITAKCLFMTDYVNASTSLGDNLQSEKRNYKDVEFQQLLGGVEFGKRFLYHLVWAMQNYNFDYFMRMDDDYFLCAERFLLELPIPAIKAYHWGWVHCMPSIVRPEESIILLSRDLVEMFLGQDPNKLYCHPWADQMIALWVGELKLPVIYRHDQRLHHHPPASKLPNLKVEKDICHKYIAVHGSYPNEQRTLWEHRGNSSYYPTTLNDFAGVCEHSQEFHWDVFHDIWRYEPKLCIENPTWDTTKQGSNGKHYSGRSGN